MATLIIALRPTLLLHVFILLLCVMLLPCCSFYWCYWTILDICKICIAWHFFAEKLTDGITICFVSCVPVGWAKKELFFEIQKKGILKSWQIS